MKCQICKLDADNTYLICNGPCGKRFHVACLAKYNNQYKDTLAKSYMMKIKNLRWFCDNCVTHPFITHALSSFDLLTRLAELSVMLEPIAKLFPQLHAPCTSTIDTNVMTSQISGEDNILSPAVNHTNSSTEPMDQSSPVENQQQQQQQLDQQQQQQEKQQLLNDVNLNFGSSSSAPSNQLQFDRYVTAKRPRYHLDATLIPLAADLQGSEQVISQKFSLENLIAKNSNSNTPKTVVKTNLTRSLYVSNFAPFVETSHILNHLKGFKDLEHIVGGIKCTKLVKKNNLPLTFVSFKLDIPRHHYDLIANPALWLSEGERKVTVKEFVGKQRALPSQSSGQKVAVTKKMPDAKTSTKANASKPAPKPSNSKNSTGTVKFQPERSTQAPKRQASVFKWQRVQKVQRQNRSNMCQKSCCSQQQQRQPLYHQHCRIDHCAGNQHGYQR